MPCLTSQSRPFSTGCLFHFFIVVTCTCAELQHVCRKLDEIYIHVAAAKSNSQAPLCISSNKIKTNKHVQGYIHCVYTPESYGSNYRYVVRTWSMATKCTMQPSHWLWSLALVSTLPLALVSTLPAGSGQYPPHWLWSVPSLLAPSFVPLPSSLASPTGRRV